MIDPLAVETALNRGFGLTAMGAAFCTIGFSVASALAARKFALANAAPGDTDRRRVPPKLPPVTILKPIKDIDHEMYENLASFAGLDYPDYQLLFALQNHDDPAMNILESIRRDFPNTDIEIIVSKNRIGFNPKVNNLSNAAPYIKHDALMISDSDIRVERDFLKKVVAPLADPEVGLVTCFYRSRTGTGLAGIFEALSINAQFLPQTMLAGILLNMRFALGAVMLVRRGVFDAAGGFNALSEHLADDFVLGQCVAAQKKKIAFAGAVVDSVPSISSLSEHLAHMSRWARTIRVCQPGGYAGLFILQGLALLSLHLFLFGPSKPILEMWLATAAIRIAGVAWIHLACLKSPGILMQLPWIPAADFLHFFTWLSGFRSQSVLWRGERYDTTVGGRLIPRRPKAVATAS